MSQRRIESARNFPKEGGRPKPDELVAEQGQGGNEI